MVIFDQQLHYDVVLTVSRKELRFRLLWDKQFDDLQKVPTLITNFHEMGFDFIVVLSKENLPFLYDLKERAALAKSLGDWPGLLLRSL